MKSCFYCKNAHVTEYSPGNMYEPDEPAMAECNCSDDGFPMHIYENIVDYWPQKIGSNTKDPEEVLPHICGHYDPHLIDKCGNCKKEINQPFDSWQIYANGWEPIACCSCKCAESLTEKFNKDMGIEEN